MTGASLGDVTILATYRGDTSNLGSSNSLAIAVKQGTLTSVACGSSTILVDASITCTATATGLSPTGTVFWYQTGNGSVSFSSDWCALSSSGQCQVTVTGAAFGSTTLAAFYAGDSNDLGSSGSFAVTVNSVTVVACANSSPVVGTPTKCTATVIGSFPTGKVTWSSTGPGKFSTHTCKLSKGACSVKYTPASAGSAVNITASYVGDKHNPSSVGIFSLATTLKASKTTVLCKPTSVIAGSSTVIKCTARVTGYSPTGTVAWSSTGTGAVSLPAGTTTCTLTKGRCSVTFTATSSGTVKIQAAYGGDRNNKGSAGTRNLKVK